jgi:RNA polymerase primary sigma factor
VSVSENSRIIRLPMNRVGLAQKASRASRQLEQDLGRDVDFDDLAKELGVPRAEVEEVMNFSRAHLSIDEPVHEDGDDTTFVDQIVDETGDRPDRELYRSELQHDMALALETLTERERTILTLYYGIGGVQPRTLEQIGAELGYTRERIRQVKEQAIDKLRTRPKSVELIEDYLSA